MLQNHYLKKIKITRFYEYYTYLFFININKHVIEYKFLNIYFVVTLFNNVYNVLHYNCIQISRYTIKLCIFFLYYIDYRYETFQTNS